MTTYYLQNQMITKLSEQSTMEEQINLSPQKSYTASGGNYTQEVFNMTSGAVDVSNDTTSFYFDRSVNYDYLIAENTGTTSLALSAKSKIGSVTGVEITASATTGTIDISGSGSFNFNNYYGYAITVSDSQKTSFQNLLIPNAYTFATDGTNLAEGLFFEITDSGGSVKGRFNIIKIATSSGYKMDLISRQNTTLSAATGYTFDIFFPTSQVIPPGASVVIPGVNTSIASSGTATDSFISLGVCPTPLNIGAGTLPGGQIKFTGMKS